MYLIFCNFMFIKTYRDKSLDFRPKVANLMSELLTLINSAGSVRDEFRNTKCNGENVKYHLHISFRLANLTGEMHFSNNAAAILGALASAH